MHTIKLNDRTQKTIALIICLFLIVLSVYTLVFTRFRYTTIETKDGLDVYETITLKRWGDLSQEYFPFMAFFLPIVASVLLCIYIIKLHLPVDVKLECFLIASLLCVLFSDLITRIHHNQYLQEITKPYKAEEIFQETNLHTLLVLICVPVMAIGIFKKWRPLVTLPAIVVVFAYISRMNEVYTHHIPLLREDYSRFAFWSTPLFPASKEFRNTRPYLWEILFFATVAIAAFMRMPSLKLQHAATPKQRLTALKEQFESGLITEEEYSEKRKEIISKL